LFVTVHLPALQNMVITKHNSSQYIALPWLGRGYNFHIGELQPPPPPIPDSCTTPALPISLQKFPNYKFGAVDMNFSDHQF
jgi:hypothetical protein